MEKSDHNSQWGVGNSYEPYMGRWSRLIAEQFVPWLNLPANMHWIDVGCGTGALSRTILDKARPASLIGIDQSDEYVSYAGSQITDNRANFMAANAMSLPYEHVRFDAAVSGLAINFVPEPLAALSEMARVTRKRGVVAIYVWDYKGEMQLIRHFWNAALELDPGAGAGRRQAVPYVRPCGAATAFSRRRIGKSRSSIF